MEQRITKSYDNINKIDVLFVIRNHVQYLNCNEIDFIINNTFDYKLNLFYFDLTFNKIKIKSGDDRYLVELFSDGEINWYFIFEKTGAILYHNELGHAINKKGLNEKSSYYLMGCDRNIRWNEDLQKVVSVNE